MKFSYENYSSNSFDNMVNITYNISYGHFYTNTLTRKVIINDPQHHEENNEN